MRQRGYTILEIAVALTVLSAGSAALWYLIKASARADKINRLHHAALAAAESELEGLRGWPRQGIKDTAYPVAGPGGEELRVVRQVFDSAKIVATLSEITLDDHMSPTELEKPLEVRVRVYRNAAEGGGESAAPPPPTFSLDDSPAEAEDGSEAPLVSLTLKLPDYRWY
jgi:prepilin-type N-terminal cleavage/methylation domain-containing protein